MLRDVRTAAGLSQSDLAQRAGVSRQMIGAIEAGHHLPRVDAALRIAAALDVPVRDVFPVAEPALDVLTGEPMGSGSAVRAGRVGDRLVGMTAGVGARGWESVDAVIGDAGARWVGSRRPGLVVAGCEPGLTALEAMLRERTHTAVAVMASSGKALDVLDAGRAHAAVVHGSTIERSIPSHTDRVTRFHLVRWQVGLAAPDSRSDGWFEDALAGRVDVVQREEGAAVQRAFLRATEPDASVGGPFAEGHVDAARRASITGLPAVTIEPAAVAFGLDFRALETHEAELWVASDRLADRAVGEALDALSSGAFRDRLRRIGGYDLDGLGRRIA